MGTQALQEKISYKLIVPSSEQVTLRNTCSGGGKPTAHHQGREAWRKGGKWIH